MTTAEPLTIDRIALARKVIELADANPEFVYQTPRLTVDNVTVFQDEDGTFVDDEGYELDPCEDSCLYVHNDGPAPVAGCIYAQGLNALGVELEALVPFEQAPISVLLGLDPNAQDEHNTDTLQGAMAIAQRRQDHDDPWGEAVAPLKAWFAKRELVVSAA